MSERFQMPQTPFERVFGGMSFINTGEQINASEAEDYLVERYRSLIDGKKTWLARNFGTDNGISADLYVKRQIVATLDYEFGVAADVYVTSKGGVYGDTTLCSEVSLDEAVRAAEEYAEQLSS